MASVSIHLESSVDGVEVLFFLAKVLGAFDEDVDLGWIHYEKEVVEDGNKYEDDANDCVLNPIVVSINQYPCNVATRLRHRPQRHNLMDKSHWEPIEHLKKDDQIDP